ncbi:hypothetical protein JW887_01905 [Candidatus Dojkabacteria bacterium]|nr:hypothetical protein [Candidatus Dojkabacteria bacterium]
MDEQPLKNSPKDTSNSGAFTILLVSLLMVIVILVGALLYFVFVKEKSLNEKIDELEKSIEENDKDEEESETNPDIDIEENSELTTKTFTMTEGLSGKSVEITLSIPKDAILKEAEATEYAYTVIEGPNYSLNISLPPEGYPQGFTSAEKMNWTHDDFGTVYKLQYRYEDGIDQKTYYYSNDVTQTGVCESIDGDIEAPCGLASLYDNWLIYTISCDSETNSQACDDIVKSMVVKPL